MSFIQKLFKSRKVDEPMNSTVVSGWRLFQNEKPLDGKRYHYSIGNQFFKGVWNEHLKGFLLDG